ncbi:hypothetical protein LINGRAHAP2_LOCUS6663, partial [Linum grandiflorum]
SPVTHYSAGIRDDNAKVPPTFWESLVAPQLGTSIFLLLLRYRRPCPTPPLPPSPAVAASSSHPAVSSVSSRRCILHHHHCSSSTIGQHQVLPVDHVKLEMVPHVEALPYRLL